MKTRTTPPSATPPQQPKKSQTGYLAMLALIALAMGACTAAPTSTTKAPYDATSTANTPHDTTSTAKAPDALLVKTPPTPPETAKAPYDLQFIDTMIAHHQGAVDMAKMAESKAQHADLKTFTSNIVASQQKEIEQMKQWREQWYASQPSAMNMDMPGMTASMKGMDAEHMKSTSGNAFDMMFIDMMIPHHQGAITMANEALQKAEHADLKKLAQAIITSQEAEIKTMQSWKSKWAM